MATFTVTTLEDSIDASDGKLSLREALNDANANAVADTVTFAAGLEGKTLMLAHGQMKISSDVMVRGDPDGDGVGITIDAHGGSRVLDITDGRVTLQGLTVTGGSELYYNGGAILARGDSLRLERCSIIGNNAFAFDSDICGGAIRIYHGTLDIVSSTIAANSAWVRDYEGSEPIARGGAIAAGNIDGEGGATTIRIVNSTITGNSADEGGGIIIGTGSTLGLWNSIIVGNPSTESYVPSISPDR